MKRYITAVIVGLSTAFVVGVTYYLLLGILWEKYSSPLSEIDNLHTSNKINISSMCSLFAFITFFALSYTEAHRALVGLAAALVASYLFYTIFPSEIIISIALGFAPMLFSWIVEYLFYKYYWKKLPPLEAEQSENI